MWLSRSARPGYTDSPKVIAKKEPPDPDAVLNKVTTFIELAEAGAYIAGDPRVHHTERSKWRHTFRWLVAEPRNAPYLRPDDPQAKRADDLNGLLHLGRAAWPPREGPVG